ncbi:MAG: sialidase family protein [Candidatus Acidiferrales bacterium]
MIEYVEGHVVYDNPVPHIHSRHGYFPGLARLNSGELICLFVMGEAFEASNCTTYISRSRDNGRTWTLQGRLYDSSRLPVPTNDSLKPTALSSGKLIATGYRYLRRDPEQGIAIPETNGFQPGENLVSFSDDGGHRWTEPRVVPRKHPELIETSGPSIETQSGELLALGALFKLPDGTNPSGKVGILMRSPDQGQTWADDTVFYNWRKITPYEARIAEMQPGRLVVIVWAYDSATDRHLPNQITNSTDNGRTWSEPEDTGHLGQASNLIWLGGETLASIHSHRSTAPGLYVRLIDFSKNRWKPIEQKVIWGPSAGYKATDGASMAEMFAALKFGQPSLLHLSGNEFLAAHWSIENGQGKIRVHRLILKA